MSQSYEAVIGLEIHVQAWTTTKAFCNDANLFTDSPNQHISPISLAHPGTLPRANNLHITKALRLASAVNGKVNEVTYYDRKHYFYPDLSKGYQITQDTRPYCIGGEIRYLSEGQVKSIRLHHIHMEEDAGKSIHDQSETRSYIDYNRAGAPLFEIVTEPDFRSGQEVHDFLTELQRIVQYYGISDGNMEEGSFRCDCNVSIRPLGATYLGERCEIKNQNSKRFAKNAIEAEIDRQSKLLDASGEVRRATLLYDPATHTTREMRLKESVNDYRYIVDPDLAPVHITAEHQHTNSIDPSTLPLARYLHLVTQYELSPSDADLIVSDRMVADVVQSIIQAYGSPKLIVEVWVNKILPSVADYTEQTLSRYGVNAQWQSLIQVLTAENISKSAAYQTVVPVWLDDPQRIAMNIAHEVGLVQSESQDFLDQIIGDILTQNADKVKEYRNGKKGLIGFFMGQVVQKVGHKADPKVAQQKLTEALNT
jgi:aspartyl-tRNA(Asn)/glutamyl-tRNA(Gln) amidotransferase subunit B